MTDIRDHPTQPFQMPPPKRGWSLRKKIAVFGTGAVAAVIVISTAIGSAGSHPAANPGASPSSSRTATTSAPSYRDQVSAWATAGGNSDLQAVSGDLQTIQSDASAVSSDISAGDMSSAATDAATLQADAATLQADAAKARSDPPPGRLAGNWVKAMRGLDGAGKFSSDAAAQIQQGNYTQATLYLDMSNALMNAEVSPALQAENTQVQAICGPGGCG